MTTNRTSFANALSAFLNHAQQADGKQLAVFSAVLEMETTFDLAWAEKFHTSTGKNKTAMIHSLLSDLYPEFAGIVEDAKAKLNSKSSDAEKLGKEKAQQKVKALENLIRSVAFAVAFFKLKNVEKHEVKSGRIRYAIKGIWDSKTGDTFKGIVTLGREAVEEKKWIAPSTSAGKASNGAANKGTSGTEIAETAEATGNHFPDAFLKLCNATANFLEVKKLEELSEAEQSAFRRLEMLVIRKVFADSKGVVDCNLINELYNKPVDQEEQAKTLPKTARKPSPKKPMTAAEAENLKNEKAVA